MVDLVGLGVSGLAAYQRALATASNNIANLQTPGYVRQRASLQSAPQDASARVSLGSGVQFGGVERIYDSYVEENLRRAKGDLKGEESLLGELKALQDALGSSEAGLHSSLQEFFDAARALEANPGSTGARASFVGAADGVASRFRGLASIADGLQRGSREKIQESVTTTNGLLKEIAILNGQLQKRSTDKEQPMQLLDKRDAILTELSAQLAVTVTFANSGAATVYSGDSATGTSLVEGSKTHIISATFDATDTARVEFVLDAVSNPVTLPTIRSGIIGGLLSFRAQGLAPAADKLDSLAMTFASEINKIHRNGLDSSGNPGKDLYYVGPNFQVDGAANAGTARLNINIVNASQVKANSYLANYDATRASWVVKNKTSGVLATTTGSGIFELDGLRLTFQGESRLGDTFVIDPKEHPALGMRLLIQDPAAIATAARIYAAPSLNNLSAANPEVSIADLRASTLWQPLSKVLPSSSGPPFSSITFSATSKPIATIQAGTREVELRAGGSAELAIFTRDGRQISGPELSAVAGQSMLTEANGFYHGATFASSYRNGAGSGTGSASYLDRQFFYGQIARAAVKADSQGENIYEAATLITDRIDPAAISAIASGTLRLNGIALSGAIALGTSVANLAAAINAGKAVTGVVAQAFNEVRIAKRFNAAGTDITVIPTSSTSTPYRDEGDAYVFYNSTGADISLNTAVSPFHGQLRLNHYQRVSAAVTSPTSTQHSISINGVDFTVASGGTVDSLATSINDADIGVTADYTSGRLNLTNALGQSGKPFVIGSNTLGIEQKSYFNAADITVDLASSTNSSPANSDILRQLGLSSGFAMREPLNEDLLVFGLSSTGVAAATTLSGRYQLPPPDAVPLRDSLNRSYSVLFGGAGSYTITDLSTSTEVAAGTFNATTREVQYGDWSMVLGGVPAGGDSFIVQPTTNPLGDNRNAAAMARLQERRDLMGGDQTLQQEYESLVNRTGALSVQAEVSRDAQDVVMNHAMEARERISGVNLDEELADLMRFQQAYQANAQVIQIANKIFDSLLQRL